MPPEAMEGLDIDELQDALLLAKKRVRFLEGLIRVWRPCAHDWLSFIPAGNATMVNIIIDAHAVVTSLLEKTSARVRMSLQDCERFLRCWARPLKRDRRRAFAPGLFTPMV